MGRSKKANFKTNESLDTVRKVINEANEALNNPARTISNSAIPETLAGTLGAGGGAAISFAALYYGGSVVGVSAAGITSGLAAAGSLVGGGMVAGIAVLAVPIVALSGGAIVVTAKIKNKKLLHEKQSLYTEAIKKQNAIIEELKNRDNMSQDRIDYLTSLNTLLQAAIRDLKQDLQ